MSCEYNKQNKTVRKKKKEKEILVTYLPHTPIINIQSRPGILIPIPRIQIDTGIVNQHIHQPHPLHLVRQSRDTLPARDVEFRVQDLALRIRVGEGGETDILAFPRRGEEFEGRDVRTGEDQFADCLADTAVLFSFEY